MTSTEDLSLARHPFRGLIRAGVAMTSVLVVVGILWCAWAEMAHRRLSAQIAAIAALHQPFCREEFITAKLPDDENAAVAWQAVFAAVPMNDMAPANSSLTYANYPPFPQAWHRMEDRSVVLNAQVFALARQAAKLQHADWGDAALNSSYFSSLPLGKFRQVANVLADAVIDAHFKRDDDAAIELATDLLQEGNTISQTLPLDARLTGIGINSVAMDRLFMIAPDLQLDGEPGTALKSVPPARVKKLIHLLLDEHGDRQTREHVIDYERLNLHETIQVQRANMHLLIPMTNLSEARLLDHSQIDRQAAGCANAVSAAAVYASHPRPPTPVLSSSIWGGPVQSARMIEASLGGDLSRYVEVEWRNVAGRRMAAVALAIRLYRGDHGHWPATLLELVPAYLDSVPTDPFITGAPIGYVIRQHALPDGSDRPMLYCGPVGDPQTAKLPATPMFENGRDMWRDLSRWYPADAGK
jgi:hypothetical protein